MAGWNTPNKRTVPVVASSKDNGSTWDVSRQYLLDEFNFANEKEIVSATFCGHTCSTLLDDGSILTAYGQYVSNGIALIRWKP